LLQRLFDDLDRLKVHIPELLFREICQCFREQLIKAVRATNWQGRKRAPRVETIEVREKERWW
jgi:hypothetical protein